MRELLYFVSWPLPEIVCWYRERLARQRYERCLAHIAEMEAELFPLVSSWSDLLYELRGPTERAYTRVYTP